MRVFSRRRFLFASIPWAVLMTTAGRVFAQSSPSPRLGPAQPFGIEAIRQRAEQLAARPYVPPTPPAPELAARIDFDAVQKIRFRADRALRPDSHFPVRLFHLDKFNGLPVRINLVSDGTSREVLYSPDDFSVKDDALPEGWPRDAGYSGFRVMDGPDKETDWLAFQGASYFRTSGEEGQYGLSVRGIAINTGLPMPEEFPRFTEFWLLEPQRGEPVITIVALLDGPSVTGIYRFDATKGTGAVVTVAAELFMRAPVERMGIAPLTSMYWYGENDRRRATDWRPEIHDSDGLALWTGAGERIWRPLINPPGLLVNSFSDTNPRGFGLLQRDRRFPNYEDDGAFYHRRPSVWVEPLEPWGDGAVQLVEIPTDDEIHDNVVAYWNPARPMRGGDRLKLSYRLHWRSEEPYPPSAVGRVVATRIGHGGVPGNLTPEDANKRKFVIDFEGGPLTGMAPRYDLAPVVTLSRGTIHNEYVVKVVGTEMWRAVFDVSIDGRQPLDLRCFLRLDDKPLTETWLYQYIPT